MMSSSSEADARRTDRRAARPIRDLDRIWSLLAALAIGVASAIYAFPLSYLLGALPGSVPRDLDHLQHLSGQIYFIAQPWHWPLFEVQKLDPPHGVNIALTDSVPVAALAAKLMHALFPGVRQGIGPWLGAVWILQPVAAVFALRSAGERRVVPAIAIAAMAAALPTFLFRAMSAALDGQLVLMVGLGLYLRAVRGVPQGRMRAAWLLAGLVPLTLFIHPYLMIMVAAIAGSMPLTLALRALTPRGSWAAFAASCVPVAIAAAGLAVCAAVFGYLGGLGAADGYGYYSMNLAAPFWPSLSDLIPRPQFSSIEATGGQYEGYQYLGLGVLAALACSLLHPRSRAWIARSVVRHAGLAVCMLVLTLYALSTHVYLYHRSLVRLDVVPPGGIIFRASGRLFWPVAYLLVIVGVRGLSLLGPGGRALALMLAFVQVDESWGLRGNVRRDNFDLPPTQADIVHLSSLLDRYAAVSMRPRIECNTDDLRIPMQVVYLAAVHDLALDTMYAARTEAGNGCSIAMSPRLAASTLGIARGPRRLAQAERWEGFGARCADLAGLALCSLDGNGFDGLRPVAPPPMIAPGHTVDATRPAEFDEALLGGWNQIESWGVWADSPTPSLRLRLAGRGPVRVRLRLTAPPGAGRRTVTVRAGGIEGKVLARFALDGSQQDETVLVPEGPGRPPDAIALTLDGGPTTRVAPDIRDLGLGLISIEVEPAPPDAAVVAPSR